MLEFKTPFPHRTREGRGLIVGVVAHVAEMLNRTGKDLGFPNDVFSQAENVEFCSAPLSHEMIAADPSNAATCPLVVSVYVLTAEPEQVYVAFRRQTLAGEGVASIEQNSSTWWTVWCARRSSSYRTAAGCLFARPRLRLPCASEAMRARVDRAIAPS
jgi:hypothetical protein